MIEAVNSVVSNSQTLRSISEPVSTTQNLSVSPARIQTAAVVAPYLSPHVDLSGGNSKTIYVVRDSSTGETVRQFPSEAQIRAYAKAVNAREQMAIEAQFQGGEGDALETATLRSSDVAKSSVEYKEARQAVRQQNLPSVAETNTPIKTEGNTDSVQFKSVASVDTQA
jgi:hypothetical protein